MGYRSRSWRAAAVADFQMYGQVLAELWTIQIQAHEFCVDTFDEETLNSLVWEVLSQINEW